MFRGYEPKKKCSTPLHTRPQRWFEWAKGIKNDLLVWAAPLRQKHEWLQMLTADFVRSEFCLDMKGNIHVHIIVLLQINVFQFFHLPVPCVVVYPNIHLDNVCSEVLSQVFLSYSMFTETCGKWSDVGDLNDRGCADLKFLFSGRKWCISFPDPTLELEVAT